MSGIKYNVTGQRTQINYGNGTGTSYEYDERNHRLKRLETRNAKSILQTIEYEYDDTGNVTERESEMLGTDGRMKHALHEYEYDSSGRLTEGSGKVEKTTAGILRPNIVSYKSKYSYDTIGNILTKTQAVNGGESSLSCNDTYTYGGKQPHAVTKAGAMVFTYDDNGNMIKRENTETKNTMTLVWDDENRLIKTTDSLHTTDYRYDANGERIIKKSELGETQYVSANYIVRNKTVISKHIFAGNQRVASTVSMKDNCGTVSEKNTMYFHPDHLGSSSYVTDKKGNFFEMIEYLPYGETLYDEAATVDKTEFRFTGHLKDDETGFYYCHARYYDPKIGRFISADDRFDDLYSAAGLNIFSYCHNNPINMIDPDGHESKTLGWFRKKDMDTPKARQARQKMAMRRHDIKPYQKKVDAAKEKNQGKVVASSPQRTSEDGYPEWAHDFILKGVFDELYNDRKNPKSAAVLEQLGDAYIKSVYDNSKDYGDGLKYQLPEGIYPSNNKLYWTKNPIITKRIGFNEGYIQNFHFKANGEIHWDPNLPLNTSSKRSFILSISPTENMNHILFDFYRRQTPLPEPWDKPFKKKKR